MREDVKTRFYGAGAALTTAIVGGALQTEHLGPNPLALQIAGTITVLSWLPYLFRINLFDRIPAFVKTALGISWVASCAGPVLLVLLVELFTGHRKEGMHWYNALWRIYAILGIWIGFAMLNERYIRPWWREHSNRWFSSMREGSVAGQAQKMAMDKRTAALESIKARVKVVLNRRKLTEKTIERKKADIEKAEASVRRAEGMLEKSKATAAKCTDSEKTDAEDVVETMKDMLENAKSNKEGLTADVERLDIDLQDIKLQLDTYQQEWTEALHVQNYTGFYR